MPNNNQNPTVHGGSINTIELPNILKVPSPPAALLSTPPSVLQHELATLLHQCLRHPNDPKHSAALQTHLTKKGQQYLENPGLSRKTAALVNNFVSHPANHPEPRVHPVLQALHKINLAFQDIRQGVGPMAKGPEAGFENLQTAFSSLTQGRFGKHPETTIKKAVKNGIKFAYNLVHKGVEGLAMQQHPDPANDAEAKEIKQAQKKMAQARKQFERELERGSKLALGAAMKAAGIAINFLPGGEVVGIAQTLKTSTQALTAMGKAIPTTRKPADTIQGVAPQPTGARETDKETSPIQTAEKIAQAGTRIHQGIKQATAKKPDQLEHEHALRQMPRLI